MRTCLFLAAIAVLPVHAQEEQDEGWGIKPNTAWGVRPDADREVRPDTNREVTPGTDWEVKPAPSEHTEVIKHVDGERSSGVDPKDVPPEKPKAAQKVEPQTSHRPPGRVTNPSKSESPVWKKAEPYKNGLRKTGNEIWDWDSVHNDIEVYDKRGRHLGSRDPTTGEMYKPAVPGRRIAL